MISPLERVLTSVRRFPDHPAVHDDRAVSYSALLARTRRIAAALPAAGPAPALGAVLVARNATGYAALLATMWAGRAYVPLNPDYPAGRNAAMLLASGADTLIVDEPAVAGLGRLTAALPHPITIVLLGGGDPGVDVTSRHHVVRADPVDGVPTRHDPADLPGPAYLLFTSGTTGTPSGVPVSPGNVAAYLDAVAGRHDLGPGDRASQTFELTFDLSVHDMFATWQSGACLHPLSARALLQPAAFIRRHRLTTWFSVPSAAARAGGLGVLGPGVLPSLRWSLFCGEPLISRVAATWQAAAPSATLDNLYGPTEATIAITGYQPPAESWRDDDGNGVLPIGWPFPGQSTIVTADGEAVAPGDTGELWLSGSQVTSGYWADPGRTADRFVTRADGHWFRTGDLVHRDTHGALRFHGRVDDQIKIGGFRVELLEVDHVLRTACDSADALTVPWPDATAPRYLIAVVTRGAGRGPDAILEACARTLPRYMVPRRVAVLDEIPRNPNGKLDRKAAAALLEKGRHDVVLS
ncbi:AMP-binding protein [Actinoplanes rectilineatus]|uniref:AMP-binding protein n=1 Tax=Actinoplanes rectilineatus TaxID=113571 RepID=UPI0005F29A56|nr:AMP-binding protein [Actinoplanes rectilineatus]